MGLTGISVRGLPPKAPLIRSWFTAAKFLVAPHSFCARLFSSFAKRFMASPNFSSDSGVNALLQHVNQVLYLFELLFVSGSLSHFCFFDHARYAIFHRF
jgi:hypothetical protein